jgi:hypothetical protein
VPCPSGEPGASEANAADAEPRAGPAIAPAGPADVSAVRYLDDRSGPVEVLRSYVNALNRREYARAYSYWEPGAPSGGLPPYPAFEQGYAGTESVDLTTGVGGADAGAGQLYFSVPVTLRARTTDGGVQTFVGCYRLHLTRPELQDTPPYQPLAISSAAVQQVPNDADTATLMSESCGQA